MSIFSSGVFFLIICFVVGLYAVKLNRCGLCWGIGSIIITPFFASLILLLLGEDKP